MILAGAPGGPLGFSRSNQKDLLLVTSFSSCSLGFSDRKKRSGCLRSLTPLLLTPHTHENSHGPYKPPQWQKRAYQPCQLLYPFRQPHQILLVVSASPDITSPCSTSLWPLLCVRETVFQGPFNRPDPSLQLSLCVLSRRPPRENLDDGPS